jgi:hypothetical protein
LGLRGSTNPRSALAPCLVPQHPFEASIIMTSRFYVMPILATSALLAALGCSSAEGALGTEGEPGVTEHALAAPSSREVLEAELPSAEPIPVPPVLFCPVGQVLVGVNMFNGGPDSDDVSGTGANNLLKGGPCNDILRGLTGDDDLRGEEGRDTLQGGNGNDVLTGGPGNDTLDGGNGDDNLFGNDGEDTLNGGGNNDNLHACDGNADALDGGTGIDQCTGDCGLDTFVNCETINCCS